MRRVDMAALLQERAEGAIRLLLRNTDTFAEHVLSDGSAFCGKVSVPPGPLRETLSALPPYCCRDPLKVQSACCCATRTHLPNMCYLMAARFAAKCPCYPTEKPDDRVDMPVLWQESTRGTIRLLLRNTDTFAEQT